jgi:hypothetical protein
MGKDDVEAVHDEKVGGLGKQGSISELESRTAQSDTQLHDVVGSTKFIDSDGTTRLIPVPSPDPRGVLHANVVPTQCLPQYRPSEPS